jgi:hypothetical protein
MRDRAPMMGQSASPSLAHLARSAVMSEYGTAVPGNDAPDEEYDELL